MKNLKQIYFTITLISLYFLFVTAELFAQSTPDKLRESYLAPTGEVAEQVLAPRYRNVNLANLSPNSLYYANFVKNDNNVPIEQFANKFYNLGGLEIDPVANRKQYLTNETPDFSSRESGVELRLTNALTGEITSINAPKNTHLSNVVWSPDGKNLAYFVHSKEATHIYTANAQNGKAKQITTQPVLATVNTKVQWSKDGKSVYAVLVPNQRGREPQPPAVELPQIRMTTTDVNRLRTSPALLQSPYEIDLLEYYIKGQLVKINVDNRKVSKIGAPAMIRDFSASPDDNHILVTRISAPFSYIVPVNSFGWVQEIWNQNGNTVATVQRSQINEGIPDHNNLEFKNRGAVNWRPDGNGLSIVLSPDEDKKEEDESLDSEDTKKSDEKIYKVVQWSAPFTDKDMSTVFETKQKFNSVLYAENSSVLFIGEGNFRNQTIFAVYPDNPDSTYPILKQKADDFYGNPGNLIQTTAETGLPVVLTNSDNSAVYLSGIEYDKNPEENAPRPFLDKLSIKTGDKERIFSSSAKEYEQVVSVLDADAENIVITRESSTLYPNSYSKNLSTGKETKLTANRDYNTEVRQGTRRERMKLKRADGFEFWVEVILPGNWNGTPLPGLIWHYPTEFNSQKDYNNSLRTRNINQYPPISEQGWPERAPEIFTQIGYAVIKADWPIYSKDGGPNDGFVYSVQQNSAVVIDSAAARGFVDRHRMAIGGHSYGGFGTAHALIYTSFFKAGIAGDANFNRTLTPFGFQRESLDLWRGKNRYLEMSPLLWADRMDGALLIYSGADDENVGTSPDMSWQMFEALNALGKTAALYMYPYSQHHTNAKEIVLDRWLRWIEWLDHYVKNTGGHVSEDALGSGGRSSAGN